MEFQLEIIAKFIELTQEEYNRNVPFVNHYHNLLKDYNSENRINFSQEYINNSKNILTNKIANCEISYNLIQANYNFFINQIDLVKKVFYKDSVKQYLIAMDQFAIVYKHYLEQFNQLIAIRNCYLNLY
jgi:hypothetical protein